MVVSQLDEVNKNYMLLMLRYSQIISVSVVNIFNEVYEKDYTEYDENTCELVKRESGNIEMYCKTLEVIAPPEGTEDIHNKCKENIKNYNITSKTIAKYIDSKRFEDLQIALDMLKECSDEQCDFERDLKKEIEIIQLAEEQIG